MTDVEHLESKMRSEREELTKLRRRENNLKAAQEQMDLYESFVDVGFTEEQAWELFKTLLEHALKGE